MLDNSRDEMTLLKLARFATGAVIAAAAVSSISRLSRLRSTMKGRIVIITGGSRGLGLALANRFGRSGARLVLCARDYKELVGARTALLAQNAVASEDDVFLVQADLTQTADANRLIKQTIECFGRIDVLINNAGVIEVGPFENQPLESFQEAMDTNFFGAVRTTQSVLPHFLERSPNLGDAAIVNIASIGGKFAMPHMLPYVASKFALVGFSEGLHAELRKRGVRVTTVCPRLMRTGGEVHAHFTGQVSKEQRWFNFGAKTPGIATSVEHAANKIYHAVVSGRTEITITPQAWLAARMAGFAPETTQFLASAVNQYILPEPLGCLITTHSDTVCVPEA